MEEESRFGFGESHAKVILIGEHSVVYGRPAIAIPLKTIKATSTIKSREDGQIVIHSERFDGLLADAPSDMTGIKNRSWMLSENKITKKDLKQRLKAWCQSHEEWDLRHASPLLWHVRCSVSFLCISAKKNCLRRQTSKKLPRTSTRADLMPQPARQTRRFG